MQLLSHERRAFRTTLWKKRIANAPDKTRNHQYYAYGLSEQEKTCAKVGRILIRMPEQHS